MADKKTKLPPNVVIVSHPLIEHSLTVLRDRHTTTEEFRHHTGIVSKVLFVEAMKQIPLIDKPIETPLAGMVGKKLTKNVIVVPVLRAGLGMLFAVQDFLPSVNVGFIGLSRDEKTAQAKGYYQKLPKIFASHLVFLVDPMLATGGSLIESVELLRSQGAKHIVIVCIVSAPEGLTLLSHKYPEITIITAAVDSHLNTSKFIVPGLGDFGDRYFGTDEQC